MGPLVKITKLRKSLKIRHFSDFSFALIHRKIGKIMKSAEYNSGTVRIDAVLFTRNAVTL